MKIKLACLALLTTGVLSTHAVAAPIFGGGASGALVAMPANGASNSAPTTHTGYATCSIGKFKGEVEYKKIVHKAYTAFSITKYKISRLKGQSGGNKANINLFGYWRTNGKINSDVSRSPDRMKQNSKWHEQKLTVATMNHSHQSYEIQFIFDKFGPDPRCSTTVY